MGFEIDEPLSPGGRLFVQPATHQIINCVLGLEQPLGYDALLTVISDSLMIKHPRFSSLLITDDHGREFWRKIEVDVRRHVILRPDPVGEAGIDDEEAVNAYIADLTVSCPLKTNKPLWEVHLLSAHKAVVMRVHHALGDGISIMSLILTLFRKFADPEQTPTIEPLTLKKGRKLGKMEKIVKVLKMIWFTLIYVTEFLLRGLWVSDGKTVVRGGEGVEMWPRKLVTAKFSLEDMKTVKSAVTDAGDAIQAMFHADEQPHRDEKIKVMECYTVNVYKCSYAPTFNRVVVHPASLEIDRDITAEPLVDDGSIPKMYFNFLPHDQLSTRRLKNQQLTGKVDDLEHAEVSATNSVLRMKVTAPGCRPVVVALWKEIYFALDLMLMVDADREVIVALTAVKVLQPNGGTNVLINPQIPVTQEMAERFKAERLGTPVNKLSLRSTRPVDTVVVVENEIRTTCHLYQQDVQTLKEHHTIEGVITEFTKGRGWFFVNCTACKCRIYEDGLVYSCSKHKQQYLSYSYSVNYTVEDHTRIANVTIFDKGILTMTCIRCYDMISDKGFMDHNKLPPPIDELKGIKWLIQLRKGERKEDGFGHNCRLKRHQKKRYSRPGFAKPFTGGRRFQQCKGKHRNCRK
ncbi:hypothetical protein SSX86_024016 [Deinandra increscens subsp. villosa]|uniref:diacylglycerol O-acyltransferase n=1 Tax=Deinandra increscens subsp. villosa TaxID=3103831 RepID=A0AAP0GQG4_9ASTR